MRDHFETLMPKVFIVCLNHASIYTTCPEQVG